MPGDEPDACQSCNLLDLKLQKKGKDVDIVKRIKTKSIISHQLAVAQKNVFVDDLYMI